MSKLLFDEFESVSAKQWKQKIQFELRGADYNDSLVWQSLEGIHVKPFYHQDDFHSPPSPIPGQPHRWDITQAVFIDDAEIANRLALDSIARGAEAIYFSSDKPFDFKQVFQEFPFEEIPIYFDFRFLSEEFLKTLIPFLSAKGAKVYYNIDLLGNLARSGNWFHSNQEDHRILESLVQSFPKQQLLSVDTSLFQNAGATMIQQLAYSLGQVNEYFHFLDTEVAAYANPSEEKKIQPLVFKVAIGSNYFFEISKIRALRKLYAILAKEYAQEEHCHILAMPSKRNKTLYDYNLNMLRTTTESMSATLGGANSVCNLPYDALYHKSNEFGERISRNQLLILKNESYFDLVSNPADGSYYIESITTQLAENALALFKEIEANGGFAKQLKEGSIQLKIKDSAQKEQQLFEDGKILLVGTNTYQNKNDTMKENLELFPFLKQNPRKTILQPILEKRLAETLEQERLSHE